MLDTAGVNWSVSNVNVTGLSNIRFDSVIPHLNNDIFHLQVDIFKERVSFVGSYVLKSDIGLLKLDQKDVTIISSCN